MKLIRRRLTQRIEHSLQTDRVTALMGPRQAGKTTLVRQLLRTEKKNRYYNLKDPEVRKVLKENGRREFEHFKDETIILDEVQMVPSLLELIQLQVDNYPERKGQFLLLGSNHLLLNRHIKESLAGRVGLYSLSPLAFGEILEHSKPPLIEDILLAESNQQCTSILNNFYLPVEENVLYKDLFRDLNIFGAYPELLTRKKPEDRKDWLRSYHQTYLETDLRQLVDLRNQESFELFEKMFATRVGSLMNITSLGRDCGLSADTIRRFISYYRQLFIAWQVKPFHTNPGKRMMKMSKYYYHDSGLLRSVVNDFTTASGHFFENTILAEIQKIINMGDHQSSLYFSRTATGVEADVYLPFAHRSGALYIEIKQAEKANNQDIKHLKKYLSEDIKSIGLLVNMTDRIQQMEERIWSVPAHWFFAHSS